MRFPDPEKLTLTNLTTSETLVVQFNPKQLRRKVLPRYTRMKPIGQSHEPLQYTGTANQTFGLDLFFDALSGPQQASFRLGQTARRFLESLAYPESTEDQILSEPPEVLVAWPSNATLVCKLIELVIIDEKFNPDGAVIQFTAKSQWEENRSTRLSSSDVRRLGAFRSKPVLGGNS